jgi:hypothetical protein
MGVEGCRPGSQNVAPLAVFPEIDDIPQRLKRYDAAVKAAKKQTGK